MFGIYDKKGISEIEKIAKSKYEEGIRLKEQESYIEAVVSFDWSVQGYERLAQLADSKEKRLDYMEKERQSLHELVEVSQNNHTTLAAASVKLMHLCQKIEEMSR